MQHPVLAKTLRFLQNLAQLFTGVPLSTKCQPGRMIHAELGAIQNIQRRSRSTEVATGAIHCFARETMFDTKPGFRGERRFVGQVDRRVGRTASNSICTNGYLRGR